jgi:hypothetical protein
MFFADLMHQKHVMSSILLCQDQNLLLCTRTCCYVMTRTICCFYVMQWKTTSYKWWGICSFGYCVMDLETLDCIYYAPYYVLNGSEQRDLFVMFVIMWWTEFESKWGIGYVHYYVMNEFEKSDVFIMFVIMWWINLKISEVLFVGFLREEFKNVSYYVMKWKNHEFAAVILKNGWHTSKRMMSLLLMGGGVKWSFPLSTWHRYLRKWMEWHGHQRSSANFLVAYRFETTS